MKTIITATVLLTVLVSLGVSLGMVMNKPKWTYVRCWDGGELLYKGEGFYTEKPNGCMIETPSTFYRCSACYAVKEWPTK